MYGKRFASVSVVTPGAVVSMGRYVAARGSAQTSAFDPKRTLAPPKEIKHWSLTIQRAKLIKIGAKVVSHGRYVRFQMAEVAVPRDLFRKILRLIDDLRSRPTPA